MTALHFYKPGHTYTPQITKLTSTEREEIRDKNKREKTWDVNPKPSRKSEEEKEKR